MSRMVSMIRSGIRTTTSAVRNSSGLKASLILTVCVNMVCGPVVASSTLPVTFIHTERAHKATAAVPGYAGPSGNISEEKKRELIAQKNPGRLPLSFEANTGQTDARVKFLSRGTNYGLYLTSDEAVMVFSSHKPDNKTQNAHSPAKRREVVRMKMVGADEDIQPHGFDELPGKMNYFLGNDPAKWRTDVSTYRKIKYDEIYPGIDLVYYGNNGELEYDFVVAPNADPGAIKLRFNGVSGIKLSRNGDLMLSTKTATLRHQKPLIYQVVNGTRTPVKGGYVLSAKGQVSFRLGTYDKTRPLIIDPVIAYSTFLGGADLDEPHGLALDSAGNIYVAGISDSTNFPLENPFQSINKGSNAPVDYAELFISKLDPTGQALLYSTYLGGAGVDRGGAIAVDNDGNLHITGSTTSLDFPVANAYQPTYGGGSSDAFLTKLGPAGNFLVYSTFLGGDGPQYLPGNADEYGSAIALDNVGNAFLTGKTDSFAFPTLQPLKATKDGETDAFLLKMSTAGALLFSTYLGGGSDDSLNAITTDSVGNIYLAGGTYSADFPVVNAPTFLAAPTATEGNAVVMKLTPDCSSITYSTLIGGTKSEGAGTIAVDASQNMYLGGSTYSRDFPVQNAVQPTNPTIPGINETATGWVAKLQSDFTALNFSTYLGGNELASVNTVALDQSNNLWVFGDTYATNFPVVDPIYATTRGNMDVTLSRFSLAGTMTFSTYLGGEGFDRAGRMVVYSDGEIYLAGQAGYANHGRPNFPLLNPYQSDFGGGITDAFIMRISPQNGMLTISGTVTDGYGKGMGGVTINLTGSATKTATTLPNGRYLFNLAPGGNYTVQATKSPLSFTPASQTFTSLSDHQVANFAVNNRNLSGQITDVVGVGVPGVTVALTGSYSLSVQTDSGGFYSIIAPSGGNYTLTPSKSGLLATFAFTPTTRTITNLSADTTGLNFTASITYFESFKPIADAHVEEGATANQNFGTMNQMRLQSKNGSTKDIYFKFDVSGISRKVINAKLRIYGSQVFGPITTAAYGVASSNWNESGPQGITWNTAPPHPTQIPGSTATITGFNPYDLDVTSYVLSEMAAGKSVISLAVHNPANSSSAYATVESRERTDGYYPELRVTTGDDNRAPSISLTTPANGTPFTAPANIQLTATASDSDGVVSKVDFYAGSWLIGTATSAPYSVTWPNVPPGNYQLFAVATDNSGGMSASSSSSITVSNGNNPPTVTLTTPLNGTTFSAGTNISLAATAYDVDGIINKVEFFAGTTLVGTATVPVNGVYTAVWNNVTAGAYSLTARATDNANGVTNSTPAAIINVVFETGLTPIADTYVRDGSSASTNFGTATELQSQLSATAGLNRESYLKFNLATVTGIAKAKLRLFGKLSDTSGTNVPVGVYSSAATSWVESGSGSITWNSKLTLNSPSLAQTTITDNVARWYEFDVTSYLQQEKTLGHDLVTLAVKSLANSNPFVTFNSRESTLATDNRPQLVLWTTQPRNALLVVGSTNLNSGDNAAKTRLQNLGFTVTAKVANNSLVTADADGKAIIVISSTSTANNVGSKFRYVPVPVVLWEFDVFDDMGMTGTTAADFGSTTNAQTALQIINSTHLLAAGLSNQQTVSSPGTSFSWGNPNVNAAKIATVINDANKVVIFGYDRGVAMSALSAPARRVGLFMTDVTAANLNTNGGLLFDAAIKWATEVITSPVIYTLTPSSGPAGTSVVIAGSNFGPSQGTNSLTFNGIPVAAGSWSDKSIAASVPFYATTGPVVVTVSGVASNSLVFGVGDTDVDGDGLADWWEMQYFGNLNQTANGDPDGDGITNLQEYQQGRNPTKSALPDANGAVDLKVYTPLASPTP